MIRNGCQRGSWCRRANSVKSRTLRKFEYRQLQQALAYAQKGKQALHCHTQSEAVGLLRVIPRVAHLFDQDLDRLLLTAQDLGVMIPIKVYGQGTQFQHVLLLGDQFDRALSQCTERRMFSLWPETFRLSLRSGRS